MSGAGDTQTVESVRQREWGGGGRGAGGVSVTNHSSACPGRYRWGEAREAKKIPVDPGQGFPRLCGAMSVLQQGPPEAAPRQGSAPPSGTGACSPCSQAGPAPPPPQSPAPDPTLSPLQKGGRMGSRQRSRRLGPARLTSLPVSLATKVEEETHKLSPSAQRPTVTVCTPAQPPPPPPDPGT